MIKSREDYMHYLESDRIALGRTGKRPRINDEIWKFERLLRRLEYYINCKKHRGVLLFITKQLFVRKSIKLGFTIPANVFGPGLNIAHVGTIVVNRNARVGKGCWIYPGVNIGANTGGPDDVPIIGDDVFLGPGAKVFGKIQIGDNTSIGANAVVTKSFSDGNQTIAGIPARKISETNSNEIIMRQRKNGKEF